MAGPPEIVPLSGFADAPFGDLTDVFGRVVAEQGGGASLAVYHRGRLVVDLVGGTHRPDTLQLVFSISKAITAIAAAIAEADGAIDLDAPIADHWPEFGDARRAAITTRMILAHRSGLPSVDPELSLDDLLAERDEVALQAQDPYWEPGTAHGYHAFTFGTFLRGIFRRALRESVGAYIDRRLAVPLGLDLWLGLPDAYESRVAPIRYSAKRLAEPRSRTISTATIPPGSTARLTARMDIYNAPELRRLGLPSTSGVATARSLARLFAATIGEVDGIRLLSPASLETMITTRSSGPDRALGFPTTFGSGVQRPFPRFPLLSKDSFGHEAAGGSAVFADPSAGVAVAFTTDIFPAEAGAGTGFLSLLPTLRHALDAY